MWKPIEEFQYTENANEYDQTGSWLVSNGQRVGEAEASLKYDWSSDEDEVPQEWVWAWTHHSTCGCCQFDMVPQPTHFQPMPNPPA